MREIKFRGIKSDYRSDKKEWVFGDYFYDGFHCVHCIREGAHIPPTYDEPGGDYHQEDHEINADTLGQYTGLKDKNGKEIYEGDTVRFNIPKLDDEHPRYSNQEGVVKCSNIGSITFGNWQYQYATDIEVIGNIYQK